MVDRTEVEEHLADLRDFTRKEHVENMRKARQDVLEGIAGYLQALTLDGECDRIEDARLPGVVALVRVFQHVENLAAALEWEGPENDERMRALIESDLGQGLTS